MPLGLSNVCRSLKPSATLAMVAEAKALMSKGHKVVSFAAGEPDFDTPAPIREAAKEALDLGMTRYAPVPGTMELKNAIIQKFKRDNDLSYTPAEIIVSNGAKHSIYNALQAITAQGDEIIIPTPCWVSYPEMVRMAGGVPVFVKSDEKNGFVPRVDDIRAAVSPRTKAFILTTPSNPTGCVYGRKALEALAELCEKENFYIISDEIYEKLIYDGLSHISIASLSPGAKARTILVNGVSKSYAMTGFRIGYAAGPREVIAAMTSYQSQATSAPNTIAQYAAARALTMDQSCVEDMRLAFQARRDVLCAGINSIPGLSCFVPSGAFYAMLNVSGLMGKRFDGERIESGADFARLLLGAYHTVVVPGDAFMAPEYCRLSYAISLDEIETGLTRIAGFASEVNARQEVRAYADV